MRILFLQNRPLFPADTGGKIRTLNVLRHLAHWHEVSYLCNVAPGDEAHLHPMRELGLRVETVVRKSVEWGTVGFYRQLAGNLASRVPFNVARHFDKRVRSAARSLIAAEPFDLVICDFLQTALHADGLTGPKRILFQHNVEAQILKRHADTARGLRRRYMALQWQRMRRFEAKTGRTFDAVVAVSETDRRVFERDYGWRHVRTIDTGVDVDYFRPTSDPVVSDRVLFLGSMDWLPNQDGVEYFVREVWPLIRRARPGATFQVVGRNPPPPIRALGDVVGVEVVGTVPDVRPYLAEAAAVVVSLRIGGGTRLKIFEAMAAGKAVVSSTVGCEGLPVIPGRHLLVEDDPGAFAAAVTRLLASPNERAELENAARRLVAEQYGSEQVARQFDQICRDVVEEEATVGAQCAVAAT
jgi:glycosyltransferase involved in cell wall biosynthesis